MRLSYLIAGIALATGFIIAIYVLDNPRSEQPPDPQSRVEPGVEEQRVEPGPEHAIEPTPPSPPPEIPGVVLPALGESDDFVRQVLSDTRLPDAWLDNEDLLRRAAVVVDNAARGQYPRRQLGFLAPEGKFRVREIGQALFIDPASYLRFNRYLDMLDSVSPELLAGLLSDTSPLLEEALRELGNDQPLLPQILEAIDQVMAVPVLRGDLELVQPKVFYEYADPALEGMSALQKQVLRMGPDNVVRLKSYVATVRTGLLRQ